MIRKGAIVEVSAVIIIVTVKINITLNIITIL